MTHGSLFDGAGGMRRGLEEAGLETRWMLDILLGWDLRDWDEQDFGRLEWVDLISGGPPCQEVSIAAHLTNSRTGSSLWPVMLRCVAAKRPNWVVLEQPPGGRAVIVQAAVDLQQLGYGCAGRIIDSKHWLPQQRARWFLCARLGRIGVALWNLLYPDGERGEGGRRLSRADGLDSESRQKIESLVFHGNCSDCLPGGIFAGVSERKLALLGAGNAVSVPVARYLGRAILEVEGRLKNGERQG